MFQVKVWLKTTLKVVKINLQSQNLAQKHTKINDHITCIINQERNLHQSSEFQLMVLFQERNLH